MVPLHRRLIVAALMAMTLGVLSAMVNLHSDAEISGQADTLYAVRSAISGVLSAPVTWAAAAVLAGWLAYRWWIGALAGVGALVLMLAVHYGVGGLLDRPGGATWSGNEYWLWFTPLGLLFGIIGAVAHSRRWWGLLARLLVPLEAVREGVHGLWHSSAPVLPWPSRVAEGVSGVILLAVGLVFGAWLVWNSPQVTVPRVRATAKRLAEDPVDR